MSGFYEAALWDVVREHLDQSIEASVDPEHRHALRNELRSADAHVDALVEALRSSGGNDAKARLESAGREVGHPEPGHLAEWLRAVTRFVRGENQSS